jgi:hypothetical protein
MNRLLFASTTALVCLATSVFADEDFLSPLPIHYVDGDLEETSIEFEVLLDNVWQLREIIPVFDDRDGRPPIAEVIVVLGEPSTVQQRGCRNEPQRGLRFFIGDERCPSTLNQLERYVDESVLFFE